ncbi:response regulator [Kiloniella antarctica]|uniref:Response regulator n=1 Tax=Kiloniella antarctica TaxID=1550907 RepID=A0ABW5BN25_9PROT
MNSHDIDEGFIRLRDEFVDQCRITTDDLESLLNQVYDGQSNDVTAIQFIRREMHNLKGQGAVFGYPVIGMIAHRLEDYLARVTVLTLPTINEVNIYLDHIRGIISQGNPLTEAEVTELVRSLPQAGFSDRSDVEKETIVEDVEVMVATSSKLHHRRLERAITNPGWRLVTFSSTLELLQNALVSPPNGVIVSGEMPLVTGIELACVFQTLSKVKNIPFAVLSSRAKSDSRFKDLPSSVELISTGNEFDHDVTKVIDLFSPKTFCALRKTKVNHSDTKSRRLNVLVAEDNQINRILLQRFLSQQPYDLTIVENGLMAVEHVTSKVFDVVLMDVIMPKMGGVEATEKIRDLDVSWAKTIPIIALTADHSAEHRKRYLSVGMNDCVGKPIEVERLITLIDKLSN